VLTLINPLHKTILGMNEIGQHWHAANATVVFSDVTRSIQSFSEIAGEPSQIRYADEIPLSSLFPNKWSTKIWTFSPLTVFVLEIKTSTLRRRASGITIKQ
tara:strand:+ start:60 stop:362 length:303 start_codon:yes stop_codon:yes gene_type:complete